MRARAELLSSSTTISVVALGGSEIRSLTPSQSTSRATFATRGCSFGSHVANAHASSSPALQACSAESSRRAALGARESKTNVTIAALASRAILSEREPAISEGLPRRSYHRREGPRACAYGGVSTRGYRGDARTCARPVASRRALPVVAFAMLARS